MSSAYKHFVAEGRQLSLVNVNSDATKIQQESHLIRGKLMSMDCMEESFDE